jgi:hypothetical protein
VSNPAKGGVDIGQYYAGGCGKRVQDLCTGRCVLVVWRAAADWPDPGHSVQLLKPKHALFVKISAQCGQVLGGECDFVDSGKRAIQGFTTLYKGIETTSRFMRAITGNPRGGFRTERWERPGCERRSRSGGALLTTHAIAHVGQDLETFDGDAGAARHARAI